MKPDLGKKGRPLAVVVCRVGPERKTLGSGLNVGNIGAEIDVITPTLPAQTHAPIAILLRFRSFAHCFFIALREMWGIGIRLIVVTRRFAIGTERAPPMEPS
jgi:hypothetical protein